jgi:hypothetical protein
MIAFQTRGHPLPDNMAGNCIVWTSTSAKKIATINDIQGLATAIRRSILSGRDPKYVSSWNATAAPIYEAMANKSHTLDVAPPPRSIVINSSMRSVLVILFAGQSADNSLGSIGHRRTSASQEHVSFTRAPHIHAT